MSYRGLSSYLQPLTNILSLIISLHIITDDNIYNQKWIPSYCAFIQLMPKQSLHVVRTGKQAVINNQPLFSSEI